MSGVKETLRIISYNHPSDDFQSVESACIPPETESSLLTAAIPSNFRQPKVVFLWLPFLVFWVKINESTCILGAMPGT